MTFSGLWLEGGDGALVRVRSLNTWSRVLGYMFDSIATVRIPADYSCPVSHRISEGVGSLAGISPAGRAATGCALVRADVVASKLAQTPIYWSPDPKI